MTLSRLFPLLSLFVIFFLQPVISNAANNTFIVEMKSEAKTIGDIRPVFIVYKDKELPKVSIKYLLKKYIKLFEQADSPAVKIDALNRINNLRVKYKVTNKKLTIDKVKQSEVVLESYDRIIDSDISYQHLDELIYQTAKAQSFIGNDIESIKRLKLLVGLYPQSELFDESMFRMAESYFELGQYENAESTYKKILTFSKEKTYHQQSRFKLGWSIFKLERYGDASKFAIETLDQYPVLSNALNMNVVSENEQELVEDTFRLLAIMFSKQKNAEAIESLQKNISHNRYAFLLYDALFRFYLTQDRFEDSALVADAYTRNYPKDFHAYLMAINTIKTYKKGKFDIQEWSAKESFVKNFGINSPYWSVLSEEQIPVIKPLVTHYLGELAHLYYVRMQNSLKSKAKDITFEGHARRAANYYLELVSTTPAYKENAQYLYLAAEALNTASKSDADFLNVIDLYEQAAYKQNRGFSVSKDAGYAAILSYEKLKKQVNSSIKKLSLDLVSKRQSSIESYAKFFPDNAKTPDLLNDLANELYTANNFPKALNVSAKVVSNPKARPSVLYSSWLVNAHSSFELQKYTTAEHAYQKALGFKRPKDQKVLQERLAASIYKQAELETNFGLSAELYLKVVDTVPNASIVPQALYDASSQLLASRNWGQAIATLSHFQSAFPEHKLHDDASEKLIYAYTENGEFISAAEILVNVSSKTKDLAKASNYLYRAADLYHENGFEFEGVQLYEDFINQYPQMFDLNIEAHQLIIAFNHRSTNVKDMRGWQKKLVGYEKKNVSKRTDRSAHLASGAALALVMLDFQAFERYKLTLPLKKSLKRKKTLLKKVVEEFESLVDYGIADIVTASTYQIAQVYRTLAQDLMLSERPNTLTELQLEQYNILLEEQAYPFEEQALDIYKLNLAKVPEGQYDKWIQLTYNVLEEMNPTEYKRKFKEVSYANEVY